MTNKIETARQIAKPLTVTEYAQGLSKNGRRNLPGSQGTCWERSDGLTMARIPSLCLSPPSPGEVRSVLWQGPAALASYHLLPDEQHPANAWLYVCVDREYGLDKLSPAMRRNVRRGLQELRIEPVSVEQLVAHGLQAIRDTGRRHGLEDSTTQRDFNQMVFRAKCPGHGFLGAWKDDQLAAFLSILEVEDWVEIRNCVSADDFLHFRPNDALLYSALSYHLVEKGCRVVTYGSSSVQSESNRAGLHAFKTKVGFEVQPVHRAFVSHPFLRPLANRLTLRGMNTVLRFLPGNLRLRKARGVLEHIAGENQMLEMTKVT